MTGEPLLMQSNGGLARVAEIDRDAASTVMSGPVGGVVACQYFGELRGNRNIVATDMGGTSFEVGLVLAGEAHIANSTWVGRHGWRCRRCGAHRSARLGLDRRRHRTGC